RVSATSASAPSRYIFAIDDSRSMVRGNFKNQPIADQIVHPDNGRSSQYAYFFEAPDNIPGSDYEQFRFLNDCKVVQHDDLTYGCDKDFEYQSADKDPLPILGSGSLRSDGPPSLSDKTNVHYIDDYYVNGSLQAHQTLETKSELANI